MFDGYGECLNVDCVDGLRNMDDESADIVLADPPYNIGVDFGRDCKDNMPLSEWVEWCFEWMDEALRVLKPTGTLYVYGVPTYLAFLSAGLTERRLFHHWLVWHFSNPDGTKGCGWLRSYEPILVAWKDRRKRLFDADAIREPYSDGAKKSAGKIRAKTKGRFGERETIYKPHEDGAYPKDVIQVPRLSGGPGSSERWFYCKSCRLAALNKEQKKHRNHDVVQHPTQKPYRLTERLLLAARSKPHCHVVIPFAGSGSECAVCEDLGLDYTAFEINPDFVQLAKQFLRTRGDAK